jgi:CRISPR-associated protein Cmr3
MDFGPREHCGGYALAVMCRKDGLNDLARRLGGEGRFVRFEAIDKLPLLGQPQTRAAIKRVRFVLVTPAIFPQGGWRPCWMSEMKDANGDVALKGTVPGTQVQVRLRAAAIGRAQSYSGWQRDGGGGGPGRPWRVVPSGSVYWFDIEGGSADALWLHSLCQDNWLRDGWGYGVLGLA